MAFKLVIHGGAAARLADQDGCAKAGALAEDMLRAGASSLDAVVQAVLALEDDGRFNAGSGSVLCMDGKTVEMDAAVMSSTGKLGAVACIREVQNPVRVARLVADTPHRLLAGEGATAFARTAGFEVFHHNNARARRRHEEMMRALCAKAKEDASSPVPDFKRSWNYPMPWQEAVEQYGCDTVGAVAVDSRGDFAVATSTGGTAPSLLGRVGDTPLVGCGYFAGPYGAIAATGIGEHIMAVTLARAVYGWIESGMSLANALEKGIALFPSHIDVGLIGVTPEAAGSRSNREMPVHEREVYD